MTKILDENFPVVMGNCIHVLNEDDTDPKEKVLICIQVENETGKVEYPIMLTQDEYGALTLISFEEPIDMVPGRIYPKYIDGANCYCVKLKDVSGSVFIGKFRIDQWRDYYNRALRHPKSITHKSIITDLFD